MNQCYRLSAGRLLMASSFSLSTARVYFSVCFSPLWPSRLATVLILAPLLRMFTAKEWRAQYRLMCRFDPGSGYENRLKIERLTAYFLLLPFGFFCHPEENGRRYRMCFTELRLMMVGVRSMLECSSPSCVMQLTIILMAAMPMLVTGCATRVMGGLR